MSDFALLLDEPGWRTYQMRFMEQCHDTLHPTPWTRDPVEFPCLAASIVVQSHIVTCFVYSTDAQWLLSGGNMGIDQEGRVQAVPTHPAEPEKMVTQLEFNRYMAANIRALVRIVRAADDISQVKYEAMLNEALAWVEQREAENRDAYLSSIKAVGESSA